MFECFDVSNSEWLGILAMVIWACVMGMYTPLLPPEFAFSPSFLLPNQAVVVLGIYSSSRNDGADPKLLTIRPVLLLYKCACFLEKIFLGS